MFETNNLQLPLLQAAQAQKHVTVNEAISRLDALAQLRLLSVSLINPPESPMDGDVYFVPAGGLLDWVGQDGNLAIFANGGWVYLGPKPGWRAWIVDEAREVRFEGGVWEDIDSGGGGSLGLDTPINVGVLGSGLTSKLVEFEHTLTADTGHVTIDQIPDRSYVMLVSWRVSEEIITDGATSWDLGFSTSKVAFGSGHALSLNSTGFSADNKRIIFYDTGRALYLRPASGAFVSGKVRFAIQCLQFDYPSAV